MQATYPPSFLKLWELAGGNPEDPTCDGNWFFEKPGLYLHAPPKHFGYWCTPVNSCTFAHTGGDGVHFGFILYDGEIRENSPVVMTVACSDTPNHIVGKDLREFLSLGCRFGYFQLEELQHQPQVTLTELARKRFRPDMGDDERRVLELLGTAFDLKPWDSPNERLQELRQMFWDQLEVKPLEE